MQREIQRTTGLGNLEAAIPYLGAEALVCVGRSLGVRNIVWVSKHLDRYLQVFNVQDRTTVVLPFSGTEMFGDCNLLWGPMPTEGLPVLPKPLSRVLRLIWLGRSCPSLRALSG